MSSLGTLDVERKDFMRFWQYRQALGKFYVVVAASDCPAHAAEDLIERVNGQSCAEVATRD